VFAIEQDRIDLCHIPLADATVTRIVQRYGINRPGGQFFVTPALGMWYFAFNHDRPAFKGPGQIPLKKAINYAIDRPALARAFGYLKGRRTDQLLPPAVRRDASIYPLGGADPATARKWLEKARSKPSRLVLYTANNATGVTAAQVFAFDLKQIGIDVDMKYFAFNGALQEKAGTRGEPYDVVYMEWAADYPDGADFFGPLLDGENLRPTGDPTFSYFDDAKTNAAIAAANGLTGEARRKVWSELDADLMRNNPPLAPFIHGTRLNFVSKSFGCFLDHPVYGVDLAVACKR
jgi:ABC-type transport system substrate-binding protein